MQIPPNPRLPLSVLRRCCFVAFALGALFFVLPRALPAQDAVVNLDPATTTIDFTLGATLHTVHGTFKLKNGQIRFDPATGKAAGAVIIDATSANTDNNSRDKKMHGEILESVKFPEIIFTPTQLTGPVADVLAGKGTVQLQVVGVFRLHGQDHEMTIPVTVDPAPGAGRSGPFQASMKFDVPYVKWGLKDPSTFLLHVSDTVNLEIHATGQISRPAGNR
jgi:polyisoprenoid-binding protein YceI